MCVEDDFGFIRNFLDRDLARKLDLFVYEQSAGDEIKVANRDVNAIRDPSGDHSDSEISRSCAVNQRSRGASEAAKHGAVGVLVRSMTHAINDLPHTGSTTYLPDVPKIPAAAISTSRAA